MRIPRNRASTRLFRGAVPLLALELGLAALLLDSPSIGSPSWTQEAPPPAVEEVLAQAEKSPLERALALGRDLGRSAREHASVREGIARELPEAGPIGRLALGAALAEAGETGAGKDAFLALLEEGTPEPVAEAAASLLGLPPFPSDAPVARDLVKALLAKIEAGSLPPLVRLRAATSLFRLGGGSEKTRARSDLRAFLRSEDENLRAEGAIALASLGDRESSREELKRLAAEPTLRGDLARAFFEAEGTEKFYERVQKKQRDFYEKREESARPRKPLDAGDPQILE
ncbi:MAG: hypothetical protein ACREIU_13375, partial [Planctomycetota bacterium]